MKKNYRRGFVPIFCPRTRPKTFLQCFALELRVSKAKHCKNVLGLTFGATQFNKLKEGLCKEILKHQSHSHSG